MTYHFYPKEKIARCEHLKSSKPAYCEHDTNASFYHNFYLISLLIIFFKKIYGIPGFWSSNSTKSMASQEDCMALDSTLNSMALARSGTYGVISVQGPVI